MKRPEGLLQRELMRVHKFAYYSPRRLDEVVVLLVRHGPEARVLAGGTDLVVAMKKGDTRPTHVVGLENVEELRGVRLEDDGTVSIGAMCSLKALASSEVVRSRIPILVEAALTMGCPEIRAMGTVGGNLCSAVPSADLGPPLLVLEAVALIYGPAGWREVTMTRFFRGPRETCLLPGEVLVRVNVKVPEGPWKGVYVKYGPRGGMDLALASVACLVEGEDSGRGARLRVALGAVAPTPIRSPGAERLATECGLKGKDVIEKYAEAAVLDARPISDMRASAEYRRVLIRALAARALRQCWLREGMA